LDHSVMPPHRCTWRVGVVRRPDRAGLSP
jgi:hypothetical protein